MKIRILTGPNAGTTTHTENTQDALLQEKLGNIEIIRYKDFRERLREEGQLGTDAHSVNPCIAEGKVEWGVKSASDSGFRVVVVIKRSGAETTYFSTPPADAPKSIIARFNDLSNSTSSNAAAELETLQRKQAEYENSIKHAKRY